MKVSMESPEVKSGNTGQPRATREIPPLYIFSQAGTCPGVPGRNLRGTSTSSSREQRTRATPFAPDRHLFAPDAGAPTTGWFCRSTALGVNRASTYSHPRRVLLPRFRSCRSTALGANRASTYSHPGRVLLPRLRSCRYSVKGQAFMCSSLNNCEESKAVSSLMHAHIPVRSFLITAHWACIFFLPRDTSAS